MTWVTWRQGRTEALIAAGLLALLAAVLVPTGLHMASVYHHDGLAACTASRTFACNQAVDSFTRQFEHLGGLLGWFNLVPGVIGVLLATPFVLELENGTYRLAWTQSITRRRWLVRKLGLTAAAALLAALAMTVLLSWWRIPLDHLTGRIQPNVFDFEGIVPFGYVLFALGLSLTVGVLCRRAAVGAITGFAGYVVARIFVDNWLRQRFEAPLTSTWPISSPGPSLSHAWIISEQPSDRLGRPFSLSVNAAQACTQAVNGHLRKVDSSCLAGHGAGYTHAVFQPASRFWLFQGIETALFAGTAAALILFAAWWVHERTS